MRRFTGLLVVLVLAAGLVEARQVRTVCGTTREKLAEQLHLHRQAAQHRRELLLKRAGQAAAPHAASRDIGEIVVMADSDGVVARLNEFNLDGSTLAFAPATGGYRFALSERSYDSGAAAGGSPLQGLEDDDARLVELKFAFPFFGASYRQVWVNSDGNLTFTASDTAITERSLGRLAAGPPRIAALFRDLDPSMSRQGVVVLSAADRLVVSWVAVPEYREFGIGPLQTFQIRLFPSGGIEYAYAGINTSSAVVGISPGRLQGATAVVSFLQGGSQEYSATVAERFGRANEIDVVTAAQQFYAAHEDAYDYLVFFNGLDIEAMEGAVAYQLTVRNRDRGFGDPPVDVGREFGSPRRLRAVLNMGPLSQFPDDPNQIVSSRVSSRDTPLTILAHEAGHLFLAYASIRDPWDEQARPMLGYQQAHWAFTFNSEASLLEGNRIRDRWETEPAASPRFTTVGVTEGFSPLDQYLMGFRAPEEVPGSFLVTGASVSRERHPQLGVSFHGERRDVALEEVVRAEGRRTPDHTVAQRRFRFAFILITRAGEEPPTADLQKIDTFRREFQTYYRKATGERAFAETALRRALRLSTFPAAGVLAGGSMPAAVELERPAQANLTVDLRSLNGFTSVPAWVIIPAGSTRAGFTIAGLRTGVDELVATPADSRYETVASRVQVARSAEDLKLAVVSGDRQVAQPGTPLPAPVVVKVMDQNELPYPGLRLRASGIGGGTVTSAAGVTGENGTVSFLWTPGPGPLHQLTVALEGAAATVNVLALGRPYVTAESIVNAASFRAGISPGALATLFGVNLAAGRTASASFPWPESLAGVNVTLNGKRAPLIYVSDQQINLLVPATVAEGTADLVVSTAVGVSSTVRVAVAGVSPGIFVDAATGLGAVRLVGGFVEIYGTGLGPVRIDGALQRTVLTPEVLIGGRPAEVQYSGLAPGWLGLYQVNARVPDGVPSGAASLGLSIGGQRSNEVRIQIR
ncbi:MAG: hypothetical protein FJW34_02500 [Acidobacteria bacterium]|nr:hypothetical protein [Acidobacteriota bacterium]